MRRQQQQQRPFDAKEKCGIAFAITVFLLAVGAGIYFAIKYATNYEYNHAINSTYANHSAIPFNNLVYNKVVRPTVTQAPEEDDDTPTAVPSTTPPPFPTVGPLGFVWPMTIKPLPPLPQAIPLNETMNFIGAIVPTSPLPKMTAIQLLPTSTPTTSAPTATLEPTATPDSTNQILTTQIPIKLSPIKQVTRIPENVVLAQVEV
jgi:hypothetical protein